jgi:quercetin dioxygenase-like cupin family protein
MGMSYGYGPAHDKKEMISVIRSAVEPARALGVSVTFEPGARTAWHTHPLGQTLIVTDGCGLGTALGRPDPGDSTE